MPHYVQRDPITRDVIAELLARARRDALGRELGRSQFIRTTRTSPAVPPHSERPASRSAGVLLLSVVRGTPQVKTETHQVLAVVRAPRDRSPRTTQ